MVGIELDEDVNVKGFSVLESEEDSRAFSFIKCIRNISNLLDEVQSFGTDFDSSKLLSPRLKVIDYFPVKEIDVLTILSSKKRDLT